MWREISRIGKKLVDSGLVESHFGNISVRVGNRMVITRSGSALDEIGEDSVVEVRLDGTCALDIIASSETIVHRAIYKNTHALAIVHAHCPFAVVMSLLAHEDSVRPADSEGQYFLGNIPIVRGGIGSEELAANMSQALASHKAAILYSHGTFAIGRVLDEAYVLTTQVEHSCKIRYWYDLATKTQAPVTP
ncbi:aldolase [Methanolobus chelungpuianus]|uniref:Fuculose phosphate aldolase n=1 Tax=Methanolobus chelungpuianus TaxID=502115 RepID=A0AAE3HAV0_9EURY|nr:aldolase [Methanolobus chelungpuianus]MCQ6962729.1 fuculose phosphate aldolase [Methanolobus chelungpuianus]